MKTVSEKKSYFSDSLVPLAQILVIHPATVNYKMRFHLQSLLLIAGTLIIKGVRSQHRIKRHIVQVVAVANKINLSLLLLSSSLLYTYTSRVTLCEIKRELRYMYPLEICK